MKRKSSAPVVPQQKRRRREDAKTEKESFECNPKEVNLLKKQILECISAIFHLTREQSKDKNNLIEEAQAIFLQITCVRVPQVPSRQLRILLPYSLVMPNDEVALFVCDLQKGKRKDYEPTVEHYRDLLDKHGCTRINEIIPINRVKTEFDQFELKKKLLGSYDHFLVDGRIAGHMIRLLGKCFIKKRKFPTSIKMQSKDLKHEIDYALSKTTMRLHSHGDSHIVQIGNTFMKKKEILKNVIAACKSLSKNYPGGWANIQALRLKSSTSVALPFYITLKNKNTVKPQTTVVQPKRPKAYRDVEGELSTFITDTRVIVKPEGDVTVIKKRKKKSTNDNSKSEDKQRVKIKN